MQNGAVLTNALLHLLMSDIKMFEMHNLFSYWTAEKLAIALS